MQIRKGRENAFANAMLMDPHLEKGADGLGPVERAVAMADLAEKGMAGGESFLMAVKQLHQHIETHGLSGRHIGMSIGALYSYWEHGEELRTIWESL